MTSYRTIAVAGCATVALLAPAVAATAAPGDPTTITVTVLREGGTSSGAMAARTSDPTTDAAVVQDFTTTNGCDPTATGCEMTVTQNVALQASNRMTRAEAMFDVDPTMKGYVFGGWIGCDSDLPAQLNTVNPASGFSPDTCSLAANGAPRSVTARYVWKGIVGIGARASVAAFTSSLTFLQDFGFGNSFELPKSGITETKGYRITGQAIDETPHLGYPFDHWTGCSPPRNPGSCTFDSTTGVAVVEVLRKVTPITVTYRPVGARSAKLTSERLATSGCGATSGVSKRSCARVKTLAVRVNPGSAVDLYVTFAPGRMAGTIVGCTPRGGDSHAVSCRVRPGVRTVSIAVRTVPVTRSLTIVRAAAVRGPVDAYYAAVPSATPALRTALRPRSDSEGFHWLKVPAAGRSLTQPIPTGAVVWVSASGAARFTGCTVVKHSAYYSACKVALTASRKVTITKG